MAALVLGTAGTVTNRNVKRQQHLTDLKMVFRTECLLNTHI